MNRALQPAEVKEIYPTGPKGWLCDLASAFILLTRIPVPLRFLTPLPPDMTRSLWAFPLVGFVVSFVGAGVFFLAILAQLPSVIAACLGFLAMIFLTGAFHEDGLADVADGFGGGFGRDRKLDIMRDSRVGTYGSLAVFSALILRVFAVGSLNLSFAIIAFLVTGTVSRYGILCLLRFMKPAREEGTGTAAGVPSRVQMVVAGLFCLAISFLLLPLNYVFPVLLTGLGALVVVSFISHRQIGGHTGDVLGAAQQVSEIAMLICILSVWRS
ncbi:adenosylcobinamide-GDP ribazoletransferase [Paremcibacter congregatus]|uniref:adenosylcobinamide-GDP ribazoletransferase n=1 Tax=Paremcibacter congregatus TaxID=2043170 RepID=UPI0030EC7A98